MPNVEWSINLATVGSLLFAISGFYWVTKSDMRALKENVVKIGHDLIRLNEIIVNQAVTSIRLDNQGQIIADQGKLIASMNERIHDLSIDRGFIRNSIDGEYSDEPRR
jgi:hypothetical protein